MNNVLKKVKQEQNITQTLPHKNKTQKIQSAIC